VYNLHNSPVPIVDRYLAPVELAALELRISPVKQRVFYHRSTSFTGVVSYSRLASGELPTLSTPVMNFNLFNESLSKKTTFDLAGRAPCQY
jgi:hypothetical protein